MISQVLAKAILITAFVTVMMVVIEYVEARFGHRWSSGFRGGGTKQIALAALLGATPGCLGAFVVVSMFAQRRVSVGALTATMIATSGDESFVMMAMVPGTALLLSVGVGALGFVVGWGVDRVMGERAWATEPCCSFMANHEACECLSKSAVWAVWRRPSAMRIALSSSIALAGALIVLGYLGPTSWDWKRGTLLIVVAVGLFVVATVPDEFLRNHLFKHVFARHLPRILAWTTGILVVMAWVDAHFNIASLVSESRWEVLALAGLVGWIPESGPHVVFTTLYAEGSAPLSILVASSIVQDGHGMLPLLAQSRKWFLFVKGINFAVGMVVGMLMLALGY